ncbi:TIM barrel protein [Candidatus Micrarchaeota archaeon]|nr:TIM barrel protein [Candidatus Micrarchaeota archaeon]
MHQGGRLGLGRIFLDELRFGTGGIPLSTNPRDTINGIKQASSLGLCAMELEFVHSVNVSKEKAPLVKKAALENNVVLTSHGSYYINLNALEKEKLEASKKRVVEAATRLWECGGTSLTFHAAFYLGMDKKIVYNNVKKALADIVDELKASGNKIKIRPETSGKHAQFGYLNEIVSLSQELEQVEPCVDFAHLHAKANGGENSYGEFCKTLDFLEKNLGKKRGLEDLHCHFSGINYNEKGELNHLEFSQSDFNYKELAKALADYECKGVLVSESPNLETDCLKLRKEFDNNAKKR